MSLWWQTFSALASSMSDLSFDLSFFAGGEDTVAQETTGIRRDAKDFLFVSVLVSLLDLDVVVFDTVSFCMLVLSSLKMSSIFLLSLFRFDALFLHSMSSLTIFERKCFLEESRVRETRRSVTISSLVFRKENHISRDFHPKWGWMNTKSRFYATAFLSLFLWLKEPSTHFFAPICPLTAVSAISWREALGKILLQ